MTTNTKQHEVLFDKLHHFQKAVVVHLPIVGLSHFKIANNDDTNPLIHIDVRSFHTAVEEIHVGYRNESYWNIENNDWGIKQYFYIVAFSRYNENSLYHSDKYPWGVARMDYTTFTELLTMLNQLLTESLHEEVS